MNQNLKFKSYSCFSCNKSNSKPTKYSRNAFGFNFTILKCKNCKSQFIDKIPSNQSTYDYIYDFGGRDSKVNLNSIFTILRLQKAKYFIKNSCEEYLYGNYSILDYGAGDGYLSFAFHKINPNLKVFATDYSYFKNDFFENINFIPFEKFEEDQNKFDLIILRHVLEHIENPFLLIKNLLNKLNQNGAILIEVPNHDPQSNIFLKFFGKSYNQIGIPWHFNHFNKKDFELNLPNNFLEFSKNSIPVLGNSLLMWLFPRKLFFDGAGLAALVFFPFQFIVDKISRSYTALVVKIK